MKLSQFAQISLKIVKIYPNDFDFIQNWIKLL